MTEKSGPFSPQDLERAKALSGAVERYSQQKKSSSPSIEQSLREERRLEWLKNAVPTLLGTGDAKQICRDWSETSDRLLQAAFKECFQGEVALFGYGKLGSHELNLSSDVDLLLVSREENPEFLTSLRKFQKLMSELTPAGFVHRVDFDLRPGGRMGPIIPTVDQFVDYYGNYGETWERLAFVRLRPLAGSQDIATDVMNFVARFSFRRHLDYTLLEDLKSLRTRIHAEHWKRGDRGRIDLKLGVGGIRDVELFFHALQVIHGGKDTSLRVKGTSEAADVLSKNGLLPKEDAEFLTAHYWNLRALENYVQALGDEQTHLLDPTASHPDHILARLKNLEESSAKTNRIVATLLGEPPAAPTSAELRQAATGDDWKQHLEEILEIPLLSRNKNRDEETRRAFLQRFQEILAEQKADRTMAFEQLKDFLRATRAKSSFFTLLLRQEDLMKELAWLFGHSRYLGRLLCYRPELLDAFVFRSQDLDTKDMERLLENLAEKRLLSEIIEGSHFLRDLDLERASAALTSTADSIVATLVQALKEDHPSDVTILALGKWGGKETGFRSDLDFIFVVANEPTDADFRFAKRLISRLTEPHRGGSIYPIDMRLRPSGKAGPLVMAAKDLEDYLRTEAAGWERQAYLKARWIGSECFNVSDAVMAKSLTADEFKELNRIRTELIPDDSRLDLKYSEGGLVDIELFVQAMVLDRTVSNCSGNTLDLLEAAQLPELRRIYLRLRQIEQLLQLIASQSVSKLEGNHESIPTLAAALNHPSPEALFSELDSLFSESLRQLVRLDPRRRSG